MPSCSGFPDVPKCQWQGEVISSLQVKMARYDWPKVEMEDTTNSIRMLINSKMICTSVLLKVGSRGSRFYKNRSLCALNHSVETPANCTLLTFRNITYFATKLPRKGSVCEMKWRLVQAVTLLGEAPVYPRDPELWMKWLLKMDGGVSIEWVENESYSVYLRCCCSAASLCAPALQTSPSRSPPASPAPGAPAAATGGSGGGWPSSGPSRWRTRVVFWGAGGGGRSDSD